jgi:hypothetical protein
MIAIVSAAFFSFSGTTGVAHNPGVFLTDWSGNAGRVSFWGTAWLSGDQLTGNFSLETVWVVSFMLGARITPPSSGRPTDLWGVSGTASGVYCGEITLTGVRYDPVRTRLVWEGYNRWVGRVPFGVPIIIDPIDPSIATIDPTGIGSSIGSSASAGFEWRVKVLGSIGGNSAFDTFTALGSRFNASLMNETLQRIRKNVSLLTRNVTVSPTVKQVNNTIFIKGNVSYSAIRTSTSFPSDTIDSLIVIGGDLIIDADVLEPVVRKNPKGIIVLKNEAGVGGNIIVTNAVKKIESSIFTEGSLYSGDSKSDLYNDTTLEVTTLGENQLYIRGSLISRNTIGGSFTTPATCVYGEVNCTNTQSIPYDLNYFRQTPPNRDPIPPAPTTRSFRDNSLDTYSLIIELDPRIATTPPPGF